MSAPRPATTRGFTRRGGQPPRRRLRLAGEAYTADQLSTGATLGSILGALLGSGIFLLLSWLVLHRTNLPAFGGSELSRAVSTVGTVLILVAVALLVTSWLRPRSGPRPRWLAFLTYPVCYLSPAGLVLSTLGIPLAATRLYLDGITVDQGFRTQFLTRLADSPAFGAPEEMFSDMNYLGMPSFYPAGWFWLGARLANLLGVPGWAAFQPWALLSLGMAAAVLVPVWQRICGSLPVATALALATTSLTIVMAAEEPYAAIIAMGAPAALVLAGRALRGRRTALLAVAVYLGCSAAMYTLFTAVLALAVVSLAVLLSLSTQHHIRPLLRLAVIGLSALLLAAPVWTAYLWELLRGRPHSGATAMNYLPHAGAQVPLPMFSLSLVGFLCLVGLLFLLLRCSDPDVKSLAVGLAVCYLWILASMLATLSGTTLLGFRLDVLVALILTTSGVFAIAELWILSLSGQLPLRGSTMHTRRITFAIVTLLSVAGLSYSQTIPQRIRDSIDLAYTDTDGYGERADRYPGDAAVHYQQIDDYLQSQGFVPGETVVLTDEQNFMSYFPYRGFQAFTSHYANPLGEFGERNKAIESLADLSWEHPGQFAEALATLPWQAPQVWILRDYKYDLAEDLYPNNPNVRFRGIYMNPEVFRTWTKRDIGPFVVLLNPATLPAAPGAPAASS